MKKWLPFIFILSLAFTGCSSDDTSVPEPNQLPSNSKNTVKDTNTDQTVIITQLLSNPALVPLGDVPIPEDNPMVDQVVKLGQVLFFDPRLSGNNSTSCASCHDPAMGYGDDRATLKKIDGSPGLRNSPTVINSGYYTTSFWDGRAASLEEQALGPIQNPDEMNQSLDALIKKLKAINGYEALFLNAFNDGITEQNIAKALAAFQRQIVVKDTPYDRFLKGETDALTANEINGLNLFAGKAFCSTCHNGQNLTDNNFYNIGMETEDEGRFAITKDEKDLGRMRTASLYGITHTAPYMHNGSIKTLEEVIDYYDRGGGSHPNKSFFMTKFMPLNLTDQEKADLLAFLKTLGGEVPVFTKPEMPGMK